MTVRRFGPVRGAGVQVQEEEGAQGITPGALGWAGYAGLFRKGNPRELILCATKTEFQKKMGGIIPDSLAPDCAQDFYSLAAGAGGLALVRVTDGNEVSASMTLYARRTDAFVPMGTVEAKNGGVWGGREKRFSKELDSIAGLSETTLQVGTANQSDFKTDEWKGGYIELEAVENVRYPIIGNTSGGLITVAADQKMLTDWDAGPSLVYYLVRENEGTAVSVVIDDGEDSPDGEFSLAVYLDGAFAKKWPNLSTDPDNARYWVNIVNNDDDNDYITVTDLWTGSQTPTARPANFYGLSEAVTDTLLTAIPFTFDVNSDGGGNPTMALGTTTDEMVEQTITVTMSSPTAGTAVSDVFGELGSVTLGSTFTPDNKFAPPFTVTAGASPLASADTLVIAYRPFKADTLEGGMLYPSKSDHKRDRFRIISNTHKTITVAAGSVMTDVAGDGDDFMVVAPVELTGGRDGNSEVVDSDYTEQAWDVSTSPFNDIEGQNLGLIKYATPGVTSTTVQKAGTAYAEAKNHQYRKEIPANITTDNGALEYINDTVGRSDYSVVSFPSYGDVSHPDPASAREGKRKTISLTGMIHGREARIAADFDGYHKAEAGTTATLPRLLAIPTGKRKLDEERLNPAGIGVIKKSKGNFVLWGDRTTHLDANWRFKHHRELMSYYEHVLQENFDFIIFAINDSDNDQLAKTAFIEFFRPEFVKRAIRGKDLKEAMILKIDDELNTDATRANGDEIAELSLKLADTVERFIIRIGKQGIFESVA